MLLSYAPSTATISFTKVHLNVEQTSLNMPLCSVSPISLLSLGLNVLTRCIPECEDTTGMRLLKKRFKEMGRKGVVN